MLFYYKYFDFSISSVNMLLQKDYSIKGTVLPIGISFFTFQSMSYVIDVYWHKVEAQKNPFKVALHIALFPQLVAGPIVRYDEIQREIDYREITLDDFYHGIRRFIVGLAKKAIIANSLAVVFLLTGIWHGAAWNFVLWGVWHGLFILIERYISKRNIELLIPYHIKNVIAHIYTLFVIVIGWVLFRADSLSNAYRYIKTMFGLGLGTTPGFDLGWYLNENPNPPAMLGNGVSRIIIESLLMLK